MQRTVNCILTNDCHCGQLMQCDQNHVCSSGLVFMDVQPEREKHHNMFQSVYETSPCVSKHCIKHGHVWLSLHETWPSLPFITRNMAMYAFHYTKHGHVCLSLHETWPCVPFITRNMAMCAFHYMKLGHVCLSLHETWPCVPFITRNMAKCAFHYMKHGHVCLSLHAVMFIIIILIIIFMHGI